MSSDSSTEQSGFTLIELLLVIGAVLIIVSIILFALSPEKKVGGARDDQRRSDVSAILNAVSLYASDNNGKFPRGIPMGQPKEICVKAAASCTNGVQLDVLVGPYLINIPVDPQQPATATGTNYFIMQDAGRHITVSAPGAEQSVTVTR